MFRDLRRLPNVNIPNILYCVCDARHILLKNITASAGWVKPVLSLPNGRSRPVSKTSPIVPLHEGDRGMGTLPASPNHTFYLTM